MLAEVVVGFSCGSLALLADAGHMLSDIGGISLALIAIWFSGKPATEAKTYGYYRSEILAGFLNALALVGISVFIFYEAYQRLESPPEVNSLPVLIVAIVGIVINLVSLRILKSGAGESLNVKAAYMEIFADLLGLAGVVISSTIILTTGWHIADPIISALIGLMIIPRTWMLLSECTHILMEGTPGHIDLMELREALQAVPGVLDIHDLHVWTITSNHHAMSAHVTIDDTEQAPAILAKVSSVAQKRFGLDHTTIQVEPRDHHEGSANHCK